MPTRAAIAPTTWLRVKELCSRALELPAGERAAFVDAECGGDQDVRREVLGLLAAHDDAGRTFLADAAAGAALELLAARGTPLAGRRIGAYRVVREVGHGGMGTVYLGERAEGGFAQRVAIKVVHGAGDEVAARFRHERRILAALDHPHVARLIDGGTTGDGLPYFVMEHVEGVPIDHYCDQRRLSVDARIDLFLAVCDAVQYAHRNLVIHRDVKPSNVLVTADGTPKLLDFGIAKLLGDGGGNAPRTRQPLLTPGYASPEQMHGRPVTTASDVFSLGVLLYELLTGSRPYRVGSGSLPELARHMETGPPTRPSSLAARPAPASVRAATPRALARRLRGDLDAVVLKALRTEPEQRYASVEALAEDLGRERRGLPVSARRGTFAYRAGKLVRRYRAAAVAAALVVLSLVGGLAATLWQARTAEAARQRAERRFEDVRQLAHSLLFEYHDAIATLPGSTPARKMMVDGALEHLDRLARDASGDAALRRELAEAYERIGDIQGRPGTANLGDLEAALGSYRKALALRRELMTAAAGVELRVAIARNLHRIGDVLWWNGDTAGAREHFERARDLRRELIGAYPAARLDLAASFEALGDVELWNGEPAAALARFERARDLLRQAAAHGEDDRLRRRLGACLRRIGEARGWAGDVAGAVATIGEALAILEPLAAARPTDAELGHSVVVAYLRLAENQAALADGSGALATYRRALARIEALAAADPSNARARRLVAVIRSRVGDELVRRDEAGEALAHYRAALATWDALVAEHPANASHRRDQAVSYRRLGDALLASGRAAAAAEHHDRSAGLLRELAAGDPDNASLRRDLALTLHAHGDALAEQAGHDRDLWRRARESYRQALDVLHELVSRGALPGYDHGEPAKLTAKIARCDQRLAELTAP